MVGRIQTYLSAVRRKQVLPLAAAVLLMVAGTGAVGYGLTHQLRQSAPEVTNNLITPKPIVPVTGAPLLMPYAEPVTIRMPSLDVMSPVIDVGLNPDGSIEVPSAPNFNNAAWYRHSPSPGQSGVSVLIGHMDNYETGASVFFDIGRLKAGDNIEVSRNDGRTAVFAVSGVRTYARGDFPTKTVYESKGSGAKLRLISCAGNFDADTGQYEHNVVVFSDLIATKN